MTAGGRFRSARERAGMVPSPAQDPDPHIRRHLLGPLFEWCLTGHIRRLGTGVNRLNDRGTRLCVAIGIAAARVSDLRKQVESEPDLLIDMLDWLVREHVNGLSSPLEHGFRPNELSDVGSWLSFADALLETGGSAWTVDRALPGLAQRVSAAERDELDRATGVDDAAAEYLREAWAAAWGVSPDGEVAYDKAIKALEAMFGPVVAPKNAGATLGQIAGHLHDKPEKWSARMDDARPVDHQRWQRAAGVSLIGSVAGTIFAANHRHARAGIHVANSLDDGRDAVTLAVALIAIQRRGFVTRL